MKEKFINIAILLILFSLVKADIFLEQVDGNKET